MPQRIGENGFVPLVDDRHLQDAENITPVIRIGALNAEVRGLLDAVSVKLTTEKVSELVGEVVIDGLDIPTVAREFLRAVSISAPGRTRTCAPGSGGRRSIL
jgi:glycine betaine/choline ABC-type transport system substrate-binding protein